ncbi:unnamed protein product [Caenorhabditis angaria]|uniref:Carboxylesterase type B domain-containing protein n=1 Tax=Caenorhabditis angaria TaxID=860376 RepID=A0A9P1IV58_9PELO|nr:unnamed protein product [Caenorhabditis angaria]
MDKPSLLYVEKTSNFLRRKDRSIFLVFLVFIIFTAFSWSFGADKKCTLKNLSAHELYKIRESALEYQGVLKSSDGIGYVFNNQDQKDFEPYPIFEELGKLPKCENSDKSSNFDPKALLQAFHSCIDPIFEDELENLNTSEFSWNFCAATKKCDNLTEFKDLPIKGFRNQHEIKWAILPNCMEENVMVTLGIGHDVDAEIRLNRTLPNTKFYGADPVIEPNLQLYSSFGKFFPFAVGREAGVTTFRILPNQNQRTRKYFNQDVTTVDVTYFLKNILKLSKIDFLWLDIEGGETFFLDFFHRGNQFDLAGISICQFNIELHPVLWKGGYQRVYDFLTQIRKENRFIFLKPMKTEKGIFRLFFINVEDPKYILESIHWIHCEIHNFGGNPKLLTLAGHSGGGTLANAITSSPQSRGLIAQQMIMSAPDGTKTRSSNSKILKTIGKRFTFCENFECLRNISAQELLDAQLDIYKFGRNFITEPHVDGEFIIDYNDILMSSENFQKIPTIIGTVTGEMSESIYSQDENGVANLTRVRELCEHFAYRNGYSNPEILAGKCAKRFGELVRPQFFSDEIEFFMPARRTAQAHESSKNVLMYSYKYSGAGEVFNKYMANTPAPMHSEDLVYVFGTHRKSEKMKMKDYLIEKVYSGIFADFVNFKKPLENENENWEIFEENNGARYFEIDFDENGKLIGNGMRNGYYQDAHKFWNEDVKKNFPKTHMEIFPNSTDSLSMTVVIEPLESHHTQKSSDSYKNLETMQLLYLEADAFLEDLKSGKISVLEEDLDHSHQSIHVFLLTVGCILLIAILYLAFTHWLMHRKREGYMLLK